MTINPAVHICQSNSTPGKQLRSTIQSFHFQNPTTCMQRATSTPYFGNKVLYFSSRLLHEQSEDAAHVCQLDSTPGKQLQFNSRLFFTFNIPQPACERQQVLLGSYSTMLRRHKHFRKQSFKCVRCKSKPCAKISHPVYTHTSIAGNENSYVASKDMNII